MNLQNIECYFIEGPYSAQGHQGWSWSYEISQGKWEIDEPTRLLTDFFSKLFIQHSSKDIYVMGFSQGGLICLDFVLFLDQPLGGVFPIAGFLREPDKNMARFHPCQKETPILIGHGKQDDRVPVEASMNAYDQLKCQGANAEIFLYNGKHKIGIDIIRKIKKKINNE